MHSNDMILAASTKNATQMIKENLAISPKWVIRAILVIYEAQTAAEQCSETTRECNGVGFNATDAEILSSFAKQIIEHEAGKSKFRTALSQRQMEIATRKITKYAGQLLKVARARAAAATRQAPEAELVTTE